MIDGRSPKGVRLSIDGSPVDLPAVSCRFVYRIWLGYGINTVVSRYCDITGMGNIYCNIRTIVITVKTSPEKQRQWWAIIQVHVR